MIDLPASIILIRVIGLLIDQGGTVVGPKYTMSTGQSMWLVSPLKEKGDYLIDYIYKNVLIKLY